MTFFFSIAAREPNPPWGVTANLCVPGRSNNTVWFSGAYPKTGGGEDVEFCLRLKALAADKDAAIVAVPEARALHPFWGGVLRQVAGWASGDVLCLEALPHSTFRALPNWAEATLLLPVAAAIGAPPLSGALDGCGTMERLVLLAACAAAIMAVELTLGVVSVLPRVPPALAPPRRMVIAVLALVPALVQDVVRLRCKLARLRFTQICLCFDWMDGQRDHVAATQFGLLVRNVCWAVAVCCVLFWSRLSAGTLALAASFLTAAVLLFARSQRINHRRLFCRDYLSALRPLPLPEDGPVPFVVLAYQRTGTNLLCGMLHNHPEVRALVAARLQ
jgi:hypothetical protein